MNRYIQKWLWIFACTATLLAGACSDDDTDDGTTTTVPPTLEITGIPDSGMHFLYYAILPQTFTLKVDAPWEITKTAGWFVVTPRQGKAGEEIEITVTGDFNDGDTRKGEFTIRANSGNNLHPCYTEKTVELSQDACNQAGITVEGLTGEDAVAFPAEQSEPLTLKVTATYDWTMTVSDESWVTVSPKKGAAGQAVDVVLTPTPNTKFETHTSQLTITAGDPDYPENSAERVITLTQYPPADSHETGYVFFEDDFAWVTENWVEPYSKYGWPGVKTDGTNNNEFGLTNAKIKPVADGKGYTYSASVYARYEGSVKLGKTSLCGFLQTPALSKIDAGKSATVLVSFYGALYASASGNKDSAKPAFPISIEGGGTIGNGSETETAIVMDNHFSWTRYSFVIQGATSATRIKFGDEDTKTYRIHLDNIRVEKAETGAEAPEPQPVTIPLDVRITPQSFGEIPVEGDDLACSIHINRAWSATSDSEWLTIEKVNCGTAANGATLATDKRSVTVLGTWLPYNDIVLKAAPNTDGEARTATLTLTIDGESTPLTMNVTQAGVAAGTPRITVTGLNNYTVPPFASDATQPRTFTVNATYDWTISVPEGDTWYTVSPLQGPANNDIEVTVTPTANPDAARGGTFTIVSKNGGLETEQPITVSQEANANVFSGLPATWTFNTADKLTADLKYPADEAGSTALFAYDRKGLASDENGVVSIAGSYLKLAGVPCGSMAVYTVPVKNFAAGTKIKYATRTYSSGSGAKYFAVEYSTDGTNWTPFDGFRDKERTELPAGSTITGQDGFVEVSYSYANQGSTQTDFAFTATVPTAIPDGTLYVRTRISEPYTADLKKNFAVNTSTEANTRVYTVAIEIAAE